jgi:2-hydroxy-3-keto-5-methylthiopentenyl-1-phosphate phosphatase
VTKASRVVLDWDGTVTERDTQVMVLDRFGDPELLRRAEEGLTRGELTLKECMELDYTGLRVPLDEANAWLLGHARVRPGFRGFAARHRPLILSSGFVEMIAPAARPRRRRGGGVGELDRGAP